MTNLPRHTGEEQEVLSVDLTSRSGLSPSEVAQARGFRDGLGCFSDVETEAQRRRTCQGRLSGWGRAGLKATFGRLPWISAICGQSHFLGLPSLTPSPPLGSFSRSLCVGPRAPTPQEDQVGCSLGLVSSETNPDPCLFCIFQNVLQGTGGAGVTRASGGGE